MIEQMIEAGSPSALFIGIATPPADGNSYTTPENITPPKLIGGSLSAGAIVMYGGSKAEAIYKAVEAMHQHQEA